MKWVLQPVIAYDALLQNSVVDGRYGTRSPTLGNTSILMPGRHLLSFDSDSWDIYFETPGKYKYIDIYL